MRIMGEKIMKDIFIITEYPGEATKCLVKPLTDGAKDAIAKWGLHPNYGEYHVFLNTRTEIAFQLMNEGFLVQPQTPPQGSAEKK